MASRMNEDPARHPKQLKGYCEVTRVGFITGSSPQIKHFKGFDSKVVSILGACSVGGSLLTLLVFGKFVGC